MKVALTYYRTTGRFCGEGDYETRKLTISDVWREVHEMRQLGRLPGVRPGQCRDCIIEIAVAGHTKHLDMPVMLGDSDHTPVQVPVEFAERLHAAHVHRESEEPVDPDGTTEDAG